MHCGLPCSLVLHLIIYSLSFTQTHTHTHTHTHTQTHTHKHKYIKTHTEKAYLFKKKKAIPQLCVMLHFSPIHTHCNYGDNPSTPPVHTQSFALVLGIIPVGSQRGKQGLAGHQ